MLALLHIRRSNPAFPLRPFLPLLVNCLEDNDPHVRDCTRSSIVDLFTGPNVTDGARTELKKEMAKKGVRKAIIDDVYARLQAGASTSTVSSDLEATGSNGTPQTKEYVPPSLRLMGQKPGATASGALQRSVSQPTRELVRPPSRAAAVPSPPLSVATEQSSTEVQTVYVSFYADARVISY